MRFFKEVAAFFRNSNLVHDPVSIRRLKLRDGLDGLCEKKNNKFIIKINKKLAEDYSVDVLIHEFAHVLAWEKDSDVHGQNWGRAYSKVYRMFLSKFID